MVNKSFCEDITEGKFSFPIIHSIKQAPDDHQLLSKYTFCFVFVVRFVFGLKYLEDYEL